MDAALDLALLRYRIARHTCEKMMVWIRVLIFMMELKVGDEEEEEEEGGGKVEKT